MKIKWHYLLLLATLAIGCDPYHSRECTGFYYDYNNWQSISENDTIKFISSNNEAVSFILQETALSEPYTEGDTWGSWWEDDSNLVVCDMAGVFIYNSEELKLDFRIEFWQREAFEQPIEEQKVFYEIAFKNETDTEFTPLHSFQIEPDYNLLNNNQTTFDSITLNNQSYYNVLQSEIDTNLIQLNDGFSFWKIMASRGKGIVYLADKKGNEYYLKE